MANANVIPDGKEKIAVFDMTNAKCPIVMGMGSVLMVSVFVYEDLKGNFVKKVISQY